jgi:hypothetical protein
MFWTKYLPYNLKMNKLIIFIFSLSLCLSAIGEDSTLRTIVRFEKTDGRSKVVPFDRTEALPVKMMDKKVQTLFDSMKQGEEAVIQGSIEYEIVSSDGRQQMKPYFIIDSIHPVSLKEIGNKLSFTPIESPAFSMEDTTSFIPKAIPVTTEVASAITMTSSLLLMESLSSGSGDPSGRSDLRKALFISAGAMATLLFIYEQLEGKTKP